MLTKSEVGIMGHKALNKIRFGSKIVDAMPPGKMFFVADIQKATSLDDKTLRNVLPRLLKNGHLEKNDRGQWFVPTPEEEEED